MMRDEMVFVYGPGSGIQGARKFAANSRQAGDRIQVHNLSRVGRCPIIAHGAPVRYHNLPEI